MAWDILKNSIASVVRTNNNQEITGENLQNVLKTIVNNLGRNATFVGVATPSTNPGTPDGPVFYLAAEHGVYSNFGPITFNVNNHELGVFMWDGTQWSYAGITLELNQEQVRYILNKIIVELGNGPAYSDLDISDESGYVLVRFENGHIRTKNFSSKNIIDKINSLFDNIEFIDVAGTDVSPHEIHALLRKNIGSEEEPDYEDIAELIIPSATNAKAGLMSAEDKRKLTDIPVSLMQSGADLDISDESGYVLVRFENGHVKTKNFDSQKTTETVDSEYPCDMEFMDDDGNILSRFVNGHIKTKNFDSSKVVFAKAPSNNCEFFQVQVDTNIANVTDSALTLQDGEVLENDKAAIYLPPSYTHDGKPARLIIFGFSTGSNINGCTSAIIQKAFPETNVALGEGYACLIVNGTPGTNNPGGVGNNGTPTTARSIVQAYNYVVNKYNIARDGVFTSGYSQGSLISIQTHLLGIIPVIASAMIGPDIELWKCEYTGKDSSVRDNMLTKFGMVEKEALDEVKQMFPDLYGQGGTVIKPTSYSSTGSVPTDIEKAFILNNIDKWIAYNPMTRFLKSADVFELYSKWYPKNTNLHPDEAELYKNVSICLPHPLKIFVGTLDEWGTLKFARYFYDAAIRGGSCVEKREYSGQAHAYYNYDDIVTFDSKYSGLIEAHASSVECIRFFNRFNF